MASPTSSTAGNEAERELRSTDKEATPPQIRLYSRVGTTLDHGLCQNLQFAVPSALNFAVSSFFTSTAALSADYEDLFRVDGLDDRPCYLPDEATSASEHRNHKVFAAPGGKLSEGCNVEEVGGKLQLNGDVLTPQPGDEASTDAVREEDRNHQTLDSSRQRLTSDDSKLNLDTPAGSSSSHGGTSGYMAESGSRSASISSNSSGPGDVIDGPVGQRSESMSWSDWVPGKRHRDEDDTHESWRQHQKHFFILSNAGKPIFSRYGDEHKLAGFSATLQAIMSFVENSGDVIHSMRAGDHQIVFAVKGPLYLVSISATEEPMQALKGQLELLHGQLLLILTKAVEKCFSRNAKFDMRSLLGGTEVVFSSLIHAFSWNPGTFLHAYTCLPLPYATRQAIGVVLREIAESGVVFALLLSGTKVISIAGAGRASLHPDDVYLLSNFVSSSESFRTTESFSPVCLPRYNAAAFLYAYVQYVESDTCLILLTADSEAFFYLKECRSRIEVAMQDMNILHDIKLSALHGGLRVEELATCGHTQEKQKHASRCAGSIGPSSGGDGMGLYHFLYRSNYLDQFVSSEYSPQLHNEADQKRLFRAYQKMHASMHNTSCGREHKMQYRRDGKFVLLSWRTADFELFAAFSPSTEKSAAVATCNGVCQWLRDMESDIFLLGTTPFSWEKDGYCCWDASLAILWPL